MIEKKIGIRQETSNGNLPPDIAWIEGRCISLPRIVVSCVLTLLTGGLFLLLQKWSVRLYSKAWFYPCPLSEATHVLVAARSSSTTSITKEQSFHILSYSLVYVSNSSYSSSMIDLTNRGKRFILHRGDRCVWDSELGGFKWTFALLNSILPLTSLSSGNIDTCFQGLSSIETQKRLECFGTNSIDVPTLSIFRLVINEILSPLILFQIASIALWCFENYWSYAVAIFFITVLSIFLSVQTTLSSSASLLSMARQSMPSSVIILRMDDSDGSQRPIAIEPSQLVPGDLLVLQGQQEFPSPLPCDGILLKGDALIDESFLTGESVPVSKTPMDTHGHITSQKGYTNSINANHPTIVNKSIPNEPLTFENNISNLHNSELNSNSISENKRLVEPTGAAIHEVKNSSTPTSDKPALIYGGTLLLEATSGALVRVTATGPLALRGRMLKAMRYPPPLPSFAQLHSDALAFLGILGVLAIVGFTGTLLFLKSRSLLALLVRAGDLVTVVLPPALPASLALGTGFALRRLARKGIICTRGVVSSGGSTQVGSPINVAGRVNCVLFDKTGTLTEDSLDVLFVSETRHSPTASGVRLVQHVTPPDASPNQQQLSNLITPIKGALATCHTLRLLNGQLVGDPLDVVLFKWTGWSMEYNSRGLANVVVSSPKKESTISLAVVRSWPFCPLLRRTTVLVRRINSNGVAGGVVNTANGGNNQNSGCIMATTTANNEPISFLTSNSSTVNTIKGTTNDGDCINIVAKSIDIGTSQSNIVHQANISNPGNNTNPSNSPTHSIGHISSQLQLYVKGAPESLLPLCDPSSVPDAFLERTLPSWTRQGYRVLLVAGCLISGVSWVHAQRMTRSEAEAPPGIPPRLKFLGAVVLVNAIKRGSFETIARLTKAGLCVGMATGDHAITAAAVARQVGILSQQQQQRSHSEDNDDHHRYSSSWSSSEPTQTIQPVAVLSIATTAVGCAVSDPNLPEVLWVNERNEPLLMDDHHQNRNTIFPPPQGYLPVVCGGKALLAYITALREANNIAGEEEGPNVLGPVRVFARLSPDDKRILVENLTAAGSVTAFCGDGANDVAALQAADVGIALATTNSDSLVASFCSTGNDPRCVLDVLIQGRASLAVSFACFRFMALYSMIQFAAVSLLYIWGQNFSDGQFIWQDLGIILPFATAIARIREGSTGLCPGRLPSRLMHPSVLVGMMLQIVLQVSLLVALYFISIQSLGVPLLSPLADSDNLSAFESSPLNTCIFLFSNFQFVIVGLLFGSSPPFQEPIYSNFLALFLSLCLISANLSWVLIGGGDGGSGSDGTKFQSDSLLSGVLGIIPLPPLFRVGVILGLVVLDVALSILIDSILSPWILAYFSNRKNAPLRSILVTKSS